MKEDEENSSFIPPAPLKTAVLFIVFNRLDTAKRVLSAIKRAKPPRIYIAADGPRDSRPGEASHVKAVRDYVLSQIDWGCEIKLLFREKNLGCKMAVSSAIDWFFQNEEMGIILEDDCLPGLSFFWFCEELLERYHSNVMVMHIAGGSYVPSQDNSYSYHFVRTGGIWGWASWRRAWRLYELEMESWPRVHAEKQLDDLFRGEKEMLRFYKGVFKRAYQNIYTWDYQWVYTRIVNKSLNIMPDKNLVVNIGLGAPTATHTGLDDKRFSAMPLCDVHFPLNHPKDFVIDEKFDRDNFKYITRETFSLKVRKIVSNVLLARLGAFLKNNYPYLYINLKRMASACNK